MAEAEGGAGKEARPAEGAKTKTCLDCKRRRSAKFFANDCTRPDGRFPYCKDCANKRYEKMRRLKNPPQVCEVCGGFVVPKTKLGICNKTAKCRRERKKKFRALTHASGVEKRYGITSSEYWKLYEVQGGKCAICQRSTGATRNLSVDHDHKIEESAGARLSVRGLLCSPCNHMLGHGRDDPEFFARAIEYLRNPPARKVLNNESGNG